MKKLLMGALLLLPLSASAEEETPMSYWASKPVQCSTPDVVIDMVSKYGEMPSIIMEGQAAFPNGMLTESRFVLAYNTETETWTLIEFSGGDQACIIGSGKGNISFGQSGTRT